MVEQRLQDGDHRNEGHNVTRIHRHANEATEGALEEERGTDIDGAENRNETQQVEPRRQPPGEPVAENGGPVIKPARRRESRGDLRHGQREGSRDGATHEPTNTRTSTTDGGNGLREAVNAARQDADDGERDGKVRELAHAAFKFLSITHAVEDFHVRLFLGV